MIRLAALITAIGIAGLLAGGPAAAEDVTAATVMKAHVAAVGGAENIRKIKTLKRSGKATMDGVVGHLEGTFEEISVMGKKAFNALDLTVFQQRTGWNGAVAWADDPMQGLREIEGDELQQISSQAHVDLLASTWIESGAEAFSLGPEATIGDKKYHVISVAGFDDMTFYIDPASHHVARMVVPIDDPQLGAAEVFIDFSDYAEFEGVKLPNSIAVDIADGTITMKYAYDVTTVNPEVDETIFEKP